LCVCAFACVYVSVFLCVVDDTVLSQMTQPTSLRLVVPLNNCWLVCV